jgi:hypothetical protein
MKRRLILVFESFEILVAKTMAVAPETGRQPAVHDAITLRNKQPIRSEYKCNAGADHTSNNVGLPKLCRLQGKVTGFYAGKNCRCAGRISRGKNRLAEPAKLFCPIRALRTARQTTKKTGKTALCGGCQSHPEKPENYWRLPARLNRLKVSDYLTSL